MTTGRINQVTTFGPGGTSPRRRSDGDPPPGHDPRRGRGELTVAGEMKLPAATTPRTHRGALATIPIAPTEFSRGGPRAGDPARRPETLGRLRHRPLGRRATPRPHAGERRL